MPTPHRSEPADTRRPSPTGPPGRSGERSGPPRVVGWLWPARRLDADRGASFVELAVVTILAAAVMLAVYELELSQTFNNGVREMVCLVQGPDCGDDTWVDADRPDEPEEYEWGGGNSNRGDNEALALDMAAARGWQDEQWTCLRNLWTNTSNWDHTLVDPNTGATGISGFNPAVHGDMPDGFVGNPRAQISWGLDHIESNHTLPCIAWESWENTKTY